MQLFLSSSPVPINVAQSRTQPLKTYTREEVAAHCTREDLWIILWGNVYDVGPLLKKHPGGELPLLKNAGKDVTEAFQRIHRSRTTATVSNFLIGQLGSAPSPSASAVAGGVVRTFQLVCSKNVTSGVRWMQFSATEGPFPRQLLPGGHLALQVPSKSHKTTGNAQTERFYSPIKFEPDRFELLVKGYPGGLGSGFLHGLADGDSASFRGPLCMSDAGSQEWFKGLRKLVLIGAGTGVIPLLGIAAAAPDGCEIVYVGCFRTENDVLLESQTEELAVSKGASCHFVVSRQIREEKKREFARVWGRRFSLLHVPLIGIPKRFEQGTHVVVCGPSSFNEHVEHLFLQTLQYPLLSFTYLGQ